MIGKKLSYYFVITCPARESVHKADITRIEKAYVGNAIFDHEKSLDADTEGESGDFFGVETGRPDNVGVEHTGTTHFEPSALFPWRDEPYVHFDRGLREAEETGPETHLRLGTE